MPELWVRMNASQLVRCYVPLKENPASIMTHQGRWVATNDYVQFAEVCNELTNHIYIRCNNIQSYSHDIAILMSILWNEQQLKVMTTNWDPIITILDPRCKSFRHLFISLYTSIQKPKFYFNCIS